MALAEQLRGSGPGYVHLPGFYPPSACDDMLSDVVEIGRRADAGRSVAPSLVVFESQPDFATRSAEDRVGKVFKLHRRPAFYEFLSDRRVHKLLREGIGDDVDCFLSQFIFKNPGAWGQPWHQDSFYFPFTPARPVMALWLAVSEATLANGCLHVLPGSQREPVHEHIKDRREGSQYGYVEIVDHDMSEAVPCLLGRGDLLAFDSHLMHCSKDNLSDDRRAAMVWHFAAAGTEDPSPVTVNDWMPLLRGGKQVAPD